MHGLASLREEMLADMARIKLIEFLFAGSASDSKPTERKAPEADNVIETVHGDLEDHLGDHITIEDIAHSYFMSPATLKNRYKARYGVPLATDLRAMRMSRARTLLSKTDKKMSDIAKEVGYDNQSKFSAAFRDFTGLTPSKWRAFNRLPGKAIDIDSFLSDEEARTDDSALGVSSNGPRDAVRSLLENLDVPASVVSPDYTIVFANAAYCELFDVEDGDEVGQLCYDLQYGLDAPCSFCRTKEVFEQGKSAMWECIFKNEPKMVFEFPLYDTDGTILKLEIRIPLSKLEAKPVQKGYEHVQRMFIDERG
jgi:AraC-like DNA-binding protein